MSDAVLDSGFHYPSPMTDWYRERPFKVAFAASLFIHAALIASVPGFRAVIIEPPKVLEVEIILPEEIQVRPMPLREVAPPAPVTVPAPPPPTVEETPVRAELQIEPRPEPVMRQPEPEPPPIARAEITPALPPVEPPPIARAEITPVLPPVAPVELRQETPPPLVVEPRPEPWTEVRAEPPPVPRVEPPPVPVPQARIEPPTPPVQPPPVQAPAAVPVPAPTPAQPAALRKEPSAPALEPRLLQIYGQSISKEIKRYQKYPPLAQRRGWEGAVDVQLQIAADGKVTSITLGRSSGRSILDEEALNMVRRASPLPQAPQNLRGRELTVTVPIVFKLQES
ncbi:MAG: energy transducer TonB [Betaproteobacteria bacterium]